MSRRNTVPQLGQGGWNPMPPSQETTLGPTDGTHHPTSINTGFAPIASAEWGPGTLSIAAGNCEDWRYLMWDATRELGKFTPPLLRPIV